MDIFGKASWSHHNKDKQLSYYSKLCLLTTMPKPIPWKLNSFLVLTLNKFAWLLAVWVKTPHTTREDYGLMNDQAAEPLKSHEKRGRRGKGTIPLNLAPRLFLLFGRKTLVAAGHVTTRELKRKKGDCCSLN